MWWGCLQGLSNFSPYFFSSAHQNRNLKKQNSLSSNLLSEITFMAGFAIHFCTKNFMKWKWLNSSGRALDRRRPVPKSLKCEGWVLPSTVFSINIPKLGLFTLASPPLPSQRLELSTLALAPLSLGSAFQFQVDLGWVPHMVILLVKVENLRHRFLHLAPLQNFSVFEAYATPSWHWAKARTLAHQKSMFTELDLAFGDPAAKFTVRKAQSWVRSWVNAGLVEHLWAYRTLSRWHSEYTLHPHPGGQTLTGCSLHPHCIPRHFMKDCCKPHFPHLHNGCNYSTYPLGQLWWFNEITV